jgi:hypothetical protein
MTTSRAASPRRPVSGRISPFMGSSCYAQPMPSKSETAARRLVAELYRTTDGRLMRWCGLSEIADRADADAKAVYYAWQQGWIELAPENDPHSVKLRDEGHRLATSRLAAIRRTK